MAVDDQTEEALGYAAEGAKYAQEYTPKDITLKDAATFVAEATPIIGDAMAAKEVYDELQKDEPNYLLAGALGGAAIIGLVPGLGDAAAAAIRKGAKTAIDTAKRVEIDPNTLGTMGGNVRLKPKEDDYLTLGNTSYKALRGQADESTDIKAAEKLFDSSEEYIDSVRKKQAKNREQEKAGKRPFQEEALALEKDEITPKEFREVAFADVEKFKTLEELPTFTEIVFALDKQKRAKGIVGLDKTMPKDVKPIAAGDKVKARLDIPAYNRFDVYVPQITYKKPDVKGAESVFSRTMVIEDVTFPTPTKPAFDIARGRDNTGKAVTKYPHATINGTVASDPATKLMYTDKDAHNLAKSVFDNPDYIHLGYNPDRGGFFYDRETSMPVFDSPLVVQIGKQIFAKRSTETSAERIAKMRKMDVRKVATEKKKPTLFNEGGMAMDDQMEMVFKSSRGYALGGAVEEVDPVSGNEVPTGSLPEEVRDDIPARLSEGEYVVPADVVRYYGVKFFEDLRSQAKMGFDTMEANGRIGGEPMGMEIVEPEDMQFDISELEVVDDGVMAFDEGGFVDDGGALGLGSEGIGLSSGEASTGIETRAYTNDAGDIIYIMFVGNTPMMAIPDGYYPLEEAKKEEPKEEPKPQARDRGPSTPVVAPEPIDYKSLTLQELTDMVDDQQSVTGDVAAGIFGIVNPLLGVAVKGAMWHQAQQIENEIKRRTTMEGVTEEDLAAYTNLLEIMEKDKPSLIERIFGEKDKPVVDPDAVDAAVKEALEEPEYSAEGWVDPDTRVTQDFPPIPRETGPNAAEAAEIAAANKSAAEAYEAGAKQPFLPFEADATAPTTDYSNPQLSNEIQDTIGFTDATFSGAVPMTSVSSDREEKPPKAPKPETPVVIPEPVDPDAFRKRKQKTGVGGRNIGGR